ncbi:T-cell surface glycoprotein CD5 [Neoarius graeffei]|uniref:T-cell surface glycoprotein CD5 n=1 Tax=Neoarius graeffei TaxID=443677 RepID=UPI00298BE7C6|nr:T-cell surface glycoprotein CD5 [Neoarius graeffei]
MCYSAKLLMDCILLLVLMPAVLAEHTENMTGSTYPTSPMTPTCPTTTCKPCDGPSPPVVGRIKMRWEKAKPCQGYILFSKNFTESSRHLCFSHYDIISTRLGNEICEERRCGEFLGFRKLGSPLPGYMIHENLTATESSKCKGTFLTCKDADSKELLAYKVVTGLLLTLIIAVFLCRFLQPTYIAVRKRFSQKRQNRWVGPTQSQSVSYHRGNHPNNNTTKRQSYPGLDSLMVYPSREPSSNRNSDYDSYGG